VAADKEKARISLSGSPSVSSLAAGVVTKE
jgi:hypothetical protein